MAKKNGNTNTVDNAADDGDDFGAEPAEAEELQDVEALAKSIEGQQPAQAPSDFEQVGAEQSPFVVKRAGAVVQGRLVGRFMRKKATGMGSPFFYQIRLTAPCVGTTGSKKKNTQKARIVKAGELIAIDESEAMKDFADLAEDVQKYQAVYDVWIRFKEKVGLDNGQSFWDIEKRRKTLRAPKYPEGQDRTLPF